MISSNATEVTIDYFLKHLISRNPSTIPQTFMSDKDRGQMNAIRERYPKSRLLLCWWHVLHAWQAHFNTAEFPELWTLMKGWIRITDKEEFDKRWEEIQVIAPSSVREYLEKNWMDEIELWSAVYRTDRTIFEEGDTNMLVEAYASSFCFIFNP